VPEPKVPWRDLIRNMGGVMPNPKRKLTNADSTMFICTECGVPLKMTLKNAKETFADHDRPPACRGCMESAKQLRMRIKEAKARDGDSEWYKFVVADEWGHRVPEYLLTQKSKVLIQCPSCEAVREVRARSLRKHWREFGAPKICRKCNMASRRKETPAP